MPAPVPVPVASFARLPMPVLVQVVPLCWFDAVAAVAVAFVAVGAAAFDWGGSCSGKILLSGTSPPSLTLRLINLNALS